MTTLLQQVERLLKEADGQEELLNHKATVKLIMENSEVFQYKGRRRKKDFYKFLTKWCQEKKAEGSNCNLDFLKSIFCSAKDWFDSTQNAEDATTMLREEAEDRWAWCCALCTSALAYLPKYDGACSNPVLVKGACCILVLLFGGWILYSYRYYVLVLCIVMGSMVVGKIWSDKKAKMMREKVRSKGWFEQIKAYCNSSEERDERGEAFDRMQRMHKKELDDVNADKNNVLKLLTQCEREKNNLSLSQRVDDEARIEILNLKRQISGHLQDVKDINCRELLKREKIKVIDALKDKVKKLERDLVAWPRPTASKKVDEKGG